MRLPWVSRAAFVALQRERDEFRADTAQLGAANIKLASEVVGLAVSLERERDRYEKLVQTVVDMKRDDFSPRPPLPVMPKDEPTLPVEIRDAISAVSEPNTRERRQIEARVRELLATKKPVGEVAKMVLAGEEVEA